MCVIGGLLYRFCPRYRGHAHRLPAAPGAMDQTVRTAIEGRRSLRCKGTGKGENHRCTLVPVLPSMSWARPQAAGCAGSYLDRTAIEGRKSLRCKGTRKGKNHRCTLVPVLPSMPWTRPQAAGCAGSRGSDCQDGHRGREAPAVQGAEGEKVTGGLLYPFCPRCRPWPSPAE